MSHIQEISRYKCQGACGRWARYEVVNDRSAVIGRFCKRCAERELYKFQHPKPQPAPRWPAMAPKPGECVHGVGLCPGGCGLTGRVGPVATKREADDLAAAMRKAGL